MEVGLVVDPELDPPTCEPHHPPQTHIYIQADTKNGRGQIKECRRENGGNTGGWRMSLKGSGEG